MRKRKVPITEEHKPDTSVEAEDTSEVVEELELPEEAAALIDSLRAERDEAVAGRLRALADFRNYQRRALDSERQASERGVIRVVRDILPVLDHFDLALNQNLEQMTIENLVGAVKIVRDEFNKALQAQGIERVEPRKGDAFDPNVHEAVMRQAEKDIEPNCVVALLQTGYKLGDQVLRPAKVAVSPEPDEG